MKLTNRKRKAKIKFVEIARSFSYKLNTGNYESRDFFCSQKAECSEKEVEKVSEALYQFCKREVIRSVNDYKMMEKLGEKVDNGTTYVNASSVKKAPMASLQGRSPAEKKDYQEEVRGSVMRAVADDEVDEYGRINPF